jgi:pimeloyl-ACP methyl ester carboxylesterase
MIRLFAVTLFAALAVASPTAAEDLTITGADGTEVAIEIHLPPDFEAGVEYSILVSPGTWYWQDRPSQPGWIVVQSDAFYGAHRIENSRLALAALRARYRPLHGGFHIAGWSANSSGVFEIAMTHSKEFLSVTGIAGMPGRGAADELERLREIDVHFVVGERDSYWREGSERWHARLLELGVRSTLEIVPGGEHVMPELANEPIFERLNGWVTEIADRP